MAPRGQEVRALPEVEYETVCVDVVERGREQHEKARGALPSDEPGQPLRRIVLAIFPHGEIATGRKPNNFVGGGPFSAGVRAVWGVPVVGSEAMPVGTALIGDFRRAVLFDREDMTISVGTVNDDFLRNVVRLLPETRAVRSLSPAPL